MRVACGACGYGAKLLAALHKEGQSVGGHRAEGKGSPGKWWRSSCVP